METITILVRPMIGWGFFVIVLVYCLVCDSVEPNKMTCSVEICCMEGLNFSWFVMNLSPSWRGWGSVHNRMEGL